MKPLLHPAVADMTVEGILHALADPIRVRIYMEMKKEGCGQACTHYLNMGEQQNPIPKSSLSQHMKVLRDAGLIRSERKGVEMRNSSRHDEWKDIFGPLVVSIMQAYGDQLKGKKKKK